jgi:hypothetical protein
MFKIHSQLYTDKLLGVATCSSKVVAKLGLAGCGDVTDGIPLFKVYSDVTNFFKTSIFPSHHHNLWV